MCLDLIHCRLCYVSLNGANMTELATSINFCDYWQVSRWSCRTDPTLDGWDAKITPCIRVPKCSAGAPVTARPSRSRQKQNVDPRKLHWFTSNVGIVHLTDHNGWHGELFRVLWYKCHDIRFLVHLTIRTFSFLISAFCRQLHFLQNRQENAVTWCILVIATMLLNISCVIWWTITVQEYLEVAIERQENTRPVFLCSEPESMAVPMLSRAVFRPRAPSWRSSFWQLT